MRREVAVSDSTHLALWRGEGVTESGATCSGVNGFTRPVQLVNWWYPIRCPPPGHVVEVISQAVPCEHFHIQGPLTGACILPQGSSRQQPSWSTAPPQVMMMPFSSRPGAQRRAAQWQ